MRFTSELAGQATAPGSIPFRLLQVLDVNFSLLDSLLVLTYSEQYDEHDEFRALHNQPNIYLNNRQAILNYLREYATNRNISETEYLPNQLERTRDLVEATINTILELGLAPKFRSMTRTLLRLDNIMRAYSRHIIRSPKSSEGIPRAITDRDTEIAALVLANKTLQTESAEARRDAQLMRQEMQNLQRQMQQMMSLLQKLQK